jgi:hypothetical protein
MAKRKLLKSIIQLICQKETLLELCMLKSPNLMMLVNLAFHL